MPISIKEAAKAGISKLRMERWANPNDHIEIHIVDYHGTLGPWVTLHAWAPSGDRGATKHLITTMDVDDPCWTIVPLHKDLS